MGLIYAAGNLITLTTLDSVTSEAAVYVKENLYNKRPSFPFRFTAKTGNQIKIDLGAPGQVTFVGAMNHNISSGVTKFKIKAAAADPPAGGDWDTPDYSADLSLCTGLNNSYLKIDQTYQYWVLDIDDAGNASNIEIGEFVLTTWSEFSGLHLMSDTEGPIVTTISNVTHYGQNWDDKYSDSMLFTLQPRVETTRGTIGAIRTEILDLEGAAGRFVFIPDDTYCHSYYVKLEGNEFPASRVYHGNDDILDWNLTLKEMTKGITLL